MGRQYLPINEPFDAIGEYYATLHVRRSGAQGIFYYRRFGPFTRKVQNMELGTILLTMEWDREDPKEGY